MNKFIIALTTFALLSTVLTQCPANCGSCGTRDSKPYCFVCQNGMKWTPDASTCTTKFEDANCMYHSASGCLGCKAGTIMDMSNQSCAAASTPIDKCMVGSTNQNVITCSICAGFYPSSDGKMCNVPLKSDDNCVNGTLDDYSKPSCMTCKAGYVSYQGVCQSMPSSLCMYANAKGQCVQCRDGNFMKFSGVCAPNPAMETMDM